MISDDRERARGMLLGAAVGDGLGRPLEFVGWSEIRSMHGDDGLRDPAGPLRPTDDTSMTIAVAEALTEAGANGPEALMRAVSERFIEWARTVEPEDAPGETCLEAVRRLSAGMPWSDAGLSWSKGSGAPMRAAPVGFFFAAYPRLLRDVSVMIARTTHGHPTAHAAAVAVAVATSEAQRGEPAWSWLDAVTRALSGLACGEMLEALAAIPEAVEAREDHRAMEQLGQGWVAEEAVAMALCAVLRHPDNFNDAVRCAVNHGGDSDTVGCIAGALAGSRAGYRGLPEEWLNRLAGREKLTDLADRLAVARESLR
jgi:ADP-ribosylglycohydrolase